MLGKSIILVKVKSTHAPAPLIQKRSDFSDYLNKLSEQLYDAKLAPKLVPLKKFFELDKMLFVKFMLDRILHVSDQPKDIFFQLNRATMEGFLKCFA